MLGEIGIDGGLQVGIERKTSRASIRVFAPSESIERPGSKRRSYTETIVSLVSVCQLNCPDPKRSCSGSIEPLIIQVVTQESSPRWLQASVSGSALDLLAGMGWPHRMRRFGPFFSRPS